MHCERSATILRSRFISIRWDGLPLLVRQTGPGRVAASPDTGHRSRSGEHSQRYVHWARLSPASLASDLARSSRLWAFRWAAGTCGPI